MMLQRTRGPDLHVFACVNSAPSEIERTCLHPKMETLFEVCGNGEVNRLYDNDIWVL